MKRRRIVPSSKVFPIDDKALAEAERWAATSGREGSRWMRAIIARLRAVEADNVLLREKIAGKNIYIRSLRGDPTKG